MAHSSSSQQPLGAIDEGLRIMQECPLCQADYSMEEISVLEESDGSHLVHITCPSCANAILAYITVSHVGMSTIGIMTDLSAADVLQLRERGPVDDDDVLALHRLLHEEPKTDFETMMLATTRHR